MHLPNYNRHVNHLPTSGPFEVHVQIEIVMGVTEYIIVYVFLVNLKIKIYYHTVLIGQLTSFVPDYEKVKIKRKEQHKSVELLS